jgi:mannose-6-phosphate isomerase-like protein (cupin superfamily)
MSYITNIIKQSNDNTNFRTVLCTGVRSQLVVMDIPVGGEIGSERHDYVEQILFILSGHGTTIVDGKTTAVGAGDVVVVNPGVMHNLKNTGANSLKVYTVYAPANHIDGRVHATKEAAEADVEDEAFAEQIAVN